MSKIVRSQAGILRRGLLWGLALLLLVALLLGGYAWKVYRQNLAVSDANLRPLPALSAADRILVLSPHPDDETLGAGGLLAQARRQGIPVRVVFMTNGDGSLSTRLVRDAHLLEQVLKGKKLQRSKNIYRDLAPIRQAEATRALGKLGISADAITFLGYPDGGTRDMWETHWERSRPYRSPYTKTDHSPYANSWTARAPYSGAQVVSDLTQVLSEFKPTVVLTTNPHDTHPDHWAAYAYLNAALAKLLLNPKSFSWTSQVRCYTFLIHHGLWPVPHGYHPAEELTPPAALLNSGIAWYKLELNQKLQDIKTAALNAYQSQLASTPQFLRGFLRANELFGTINTIDINPSQWTVLINDPMQDLLLPELVRAGDITTVEMNQQPKVLLVRLQLDGRSWKGLQYVVTLHGIHSNSINVERIVIQPGHNTASITSGVAGKDIQQTKVPVVVENQQITVSIPMALAKNVVSENAVFLISASSVFQNKVVDMTPAQIVAWKKP